MDKFDSYIMPTCTGLLFGAFAFLTISPSGYSVGGFVTTAFVWAAALAACKGSSQPIVDDSLQLKINENAHLIHASHEERIKDIHKQLDSIRTAINMKQLGR